ncbi:sigma-70 family RNA polymerase sigma factor [Candidatus Peregrinibacteria bacterium]|jgi:RNA polymerase sigma-70 factor, ECF subfamily|nr:sigma-70 family RNA polymerase sigma factor [Candidatus Peregrinibacteria bacterium]
MAFIYNKNEVEKLVKLSQKGDSQAFGQVYDIFVDAIYRYVFYRVKNEEVEDLVEIVFLKAWENINKYKKGQFSFSSWLFRIAHNLVIDYYRTHDKVSVLDEKLEETLESYKREHQPIKRAESSLNNDILFRALNNLKKPYQDLIVLKFVNGLSNGEVAKILGKREASLRVMQFRALKELRNTLKSFEFEV